MQHTKLNYLLMEHIVDVLTRCSLFRGMAEDDIHAVLVGIDHRTVEYAKGETYCLDGDLCRHADIVLGGQLVVRMTGMSGRQVEVIRLFNGDIIAPCFIFATDRRLPVGIEAVECTRVLRMSASTLESLVDTYPLIRHNFIATLSDIGSYLASRIGFLSLMTVREKVVFFLRSEAAAQHSLCLRLDKTRQCIADSFAVQKYSLLRCLADLQGQGIISVNGREIRILDIRRLR